MSLFSSLQQAVLLPQPALLKAGLVLTSLLVVTAGCGQSSEPPPAAAPSASVASPSPDVAEAEPSPSVAPPAPEEADSTVISATGIGPAQLGMRLGDLKAALGSETEFEVKSPFIVDFDAIAVRQGDEVLFYILSLPDAPLTDADPIEGLYTDNPKFRTDAGVGPGTPIAEAEQAYGAATLSYNTQNESREYARFQQQPSANISFATGNGNENTAGIYPSPIQDYNETQDYRDDAKIQSVLVVCLTEGCSPPAN